MDGRQRQGPMGEAQRETPRESQGRQPSAADGPLPGPGRTAQAAAGVRGRPAVAAVVLAAGMATRMGGVKQVLPVDGEPMVRRVVAAALMAGLSPVWVVTGHGAAAVQAALAGMPPDVRFVYNPDYAAGQAASLKAGVRAAAGDAAALGAGARGPDETAAGPRLAAAAPQGLAVLLADQPFVQPATLRRLVDLAFEPGALAAAAAYGPGRPGPPCVLRPPLWPAVLQLTGDRGARAVLLAAGGALRVLPVSPEELGDIDGPGDLELIRRPRPR
ncbi:MAG TPA: nucleotidyltransferase family protein [Limnochordales bacterium]|nr:nucleotidyltransferase family protein [Limnochordales bacterium]